MKWFRLALCLLALDSRAGTNEVLVSTTSATGQFVAHAPTALLSSAVCAFAEKTKRDWLRQLDLTDAWRDPIVFVVRERANAPPVSIEEFQIQDRIKYEVTFAVPPALDEARVAAATIAALCAELANRDQPRSRGVPYMTAPIPLWLAEGFAQANIGSPDQLLAITRRSLTGGRPQQAKEIMRTSLLPEDSDGSATLFRANAWLLTDSFLRLPSGSRKLRDLIAALGASKTFARAFEAVYGNEFPDGEALEKWWSLELVRRSESIVAGELSAAETARQLDALLQFENARQSAFGQLWRFYKEKWLRPVLRNRRLGLETLRLRAHPLYRSVIAGYIDAIGQLREQKHYRFRRSAEEADRRRMTVETQIRQVQEVLDRAERIYSTTSPETFQEFFRTLDRLEKFEQQRRNPISDYLDEFDQ